MSEGRDADMPKTMAVMAKSVEGTRVPLRYARPGVPRSSDHLKQGIQQRAGQEVREEFPAIFAVGHQHEARATLG